MKVLKFLSMAAIAMTMLFSASCSDDDDPVSYLGGISAKLVAPEGTTAFSVQGLEVKLMNVVDQTEKVATSDAEGVVLFEKLTAGAYNLTVNNDKVTAVINGIKVVAKQTTELLVPLQKVHPHEGLVVKEVFYSGHSMMYDMYAVCGFKDSFIEIFNNSQDVIYLDGLHIAEAWNQTAMDSPTAARTPILEDTSLDHNYVYTHMVMKIPGSGKEHALQPGKSFLIATNALNFRDEITKTLTDLGETPDPEAMSHILDMTNADMETYAVPYIQKNGGVGEVDFDFDNPNVANVETVYLEQKEATYFLLQILGSSIILFQPDAEMGKQDLVSYRYQTLDEESKREIALMKVPVDKIIDGCDFVYSADNARWKRLPSQIDAGFQWVPDEMEAYCCMGYSVRRVLDAEKSAKAGRCVLKDTNNSSNDFEAVMDPTPKGGYAGFDIK